MGIAKEGEIEPRKLSMWIQTLAMLPRKRGTIFRIKAILAVKGYPLKHVYHAVMDASDEDSAGPWAEGEKKISKIVFIGKSIVCGAHHTCFLCFASLPSAQRSRLAHPRGTVQTP